MITVRDVSDDGTNTVLFRDDHGDTLRLEKLDDLDRLRFSADSADVSTPAQLTRIANELLRIAKEWEENGL